MYMMREVYQAERGQVPELVAALKVLDKGFEQAGYRNRRIFVDYDGPMDTMVYEFETESLDRYFSMEREIFVNPDSDTKALIDAFNTNAKSGSRTIYEVTQ
jgi:hypothetical protein